MATATALSAPRLIDVEGLDAPALAAARREG
jgi:hypothetical protein